MTANTTNCFWCCPICRWSPFGHIRTEAEEVLFTMDKILKNVFHILSKWKLCGLLVAILCSNQRNEGISGVFSISTTFDFDYTQLKNCWALIFWKNIGSCSPDLHGIFIYVAWMAAYNPYTSKRISQNWRQSMACSIMEISFFLCMWRELLELALLPWGLCLCLYKENVSLDSSGGLFSPLLDCEAKSNVTSGCLCQRSSRDCRGWSWERCCWPVESRVLIQPSFCTSWPCCLKVAVQNKLVPMFRDTGEVQNCISSPMVAT